MTWEIKLNYYRCPYLNMKHVKVRTYQNECSHLRNIGKTCNSTNCPIKVLK